eukprot:RCo025386
MEHFMCSVLKLSIGKQLAGTQEASAHSSDEEDISNLHKESLLPLAAMFGTEWTGLYCTGFTARISVFPLPTVGCMCAQPIHAEKAKRLDWRRCFISLVCFPRVVNVAMMPCRLLCYALK